MVERRGMVVAVVLGLAGVVFPSCGGETLDGAKSGQSWLAICTADADCGGLTCLCGVCTKKCDAVSACANISPAAKCEGVSGCREAGTACVARCDDAAACTKVGSGLTCTAGQCLPAGAQDDDAGAGGRPGVTAAKDASAGGATDNTEAGQCLGAPCSLGPRVDGGPAPGDISCCPGFYCNVELAAFECGRAQRGGPCGTLLHGACYPTGLVPCEPNWPLGRCPNGRVPGSTASPQQTCCAPLGGSRFLACIDPATDPVACVEPRPAP